MLRKYLMIAVLIVCSIAPLKAMFVSGAGIKLRQQMNKKYSEEQHKTTTTLFRKYKDAWGVTTEYVLLRDLITLGWPYHDAKCEEYINSFVLPKNAYELVTNKFWNNLFLYDVMRHEVTFVSHHYFRNCFIASLIERTIKDVPNTIDFKTILANNYVTIGDICYQYIPNDSANDLTVTLVDKEGTRVSLKRQHHEAESSMTYIPDHEAESSMTYIPGPNAVGVVTKGGDLFSIRDILSDGQVHYFKCKAFPDGRMCGSSLCYDSNNRLLYILDKKTTEMKGVWGFSFDYHRAQKRLEQLSNKLEALMVIGAIDKKENRKNKIFYNDICGQASNMLGKVESLRQRVDIIEPNNPYGMHYKDFIQHCVTILDNIQPFTLKANLPDRPISIIPGYKRTIVYSLLPLVIACYTHEYLTPDQIEIIKNIQVIKPTELSNYKRTSKCSYFRNHAGWLPGQHHLEMAKASKLNANFWPIAPKKRKYIVTVVKERAYENRHSDDLKKLISSYFPRPIDSAIHAELCDMVNSRYAGAEIDKRVMLEDSFNENIIAFLNKDVWKPEMRYFCG